MREEMSCGRAQRKCGQSVRVCDAPRCTEQHGPRTSALPDHDEIKGHGDHRCDRAPNTPLPFPALRRSKFGQLAAAADGRDEPQ